MPLFAFYDAERFFGEPEPAPGVRVCFVADKLFAARERDTGRPVDRHLVGEDGLVVEEVATDVLVWPSSLWRVGDLEWAVRLQPGNRWVRCRAFTVVEQVPAWLVAGPSGHAVQWVIDRARTLTSDQVAVLAAMPGEDEQPLKRTLWDRWRRAGQSGSPVGCGLATLHDAVEAAARRVSPHLFGRDEQDDVEVLSDPAWREAGRAANSAALALGAPDLLGTEQNAMLAHRWTSVLGRPSARAWPEV